MNNITLIALFASICAAQSATSHVFADTQAEGTPISSATAELEEILSNLTVIKLQPVIANSWEGQVLTAAEQGVRKTLHLNLTELGPPAIYTLSLPVGDVLVARWSGGGIGRSEKAIWLWDTPYETTFITEVKPSLLQLNELTGYCEALFAWNNFIELKSLRLTYLGSEPGQERVIGTASYLQTSRQIYRLRFNAANINGHAYVVVRMSKSLFVYPLGVDAVPERFPPLSTRLKGMARAGLFTELGMGFASQPTISYPKNRDAIVLTELITRGPLTDPELREVILGRFGDEAARNSEIVLSRLNALLRALEEKNQLAIYLPALQRILLEGVAPVGGFMSEALAGRLFGVMQINHVDAAPVAFAFLDQGRFVQLSLLYLQQNTHDSSTLEKLAEVHVPGEFQEQKDRAVENIRRQLAPKK